MELDDHQMPLFEWHPLAEEFYRRLGRVSASIERFWPKYRSAPRELARQVFGRIEIYPLELLLGKWTVEKIFNGYCEGAPSYRYDHYIPYLGDDILWSLAPYGLLKLPEGEIFRRTLILVIRCETMVADQYAHLALAKIDEVLQAQTREIDAFHTTLAARVDELLYLAHRDGLHALPT
jgi:hypothetical protein